jgi:hypothetical protein
VTRKATLAERRRTCPVCGTAFYVERPCRKKRFCGHRCAFTVIGDTVRAAANAPQVRAKMADARRGRGNGVYVKRGGRHEHRVEAEQSLGRPLTSDEIVTIARVVYPNRSAFFRALGRKVHP